MRHARLGSASDPRPPPPFHPTSPEAPAAAAAPREQRNFYSFHTLPCSPCNITQLTGFSVCVPSVGALLYTTSGGSFDSCHVLRDTPPAC